MPSLTTPIWNQLKLHYNKSIMLACEQ